MKIRLAKEWTAVNKMDVIWKFDLPDNLKRKTLQVTVEVVLISGVTAWT